jgi:hypothetical protein
VLLLQSRRIIQVFSRRVGPEGTGGPLFKDRGEVLGILTVGADPPPPGVPAPSR